MAVVSIRKILSAVAIAACLSTADVVSAQTAEVKPLFEYPQIPDKLTKVNMRSNFMVQHLWDDCKLDKPIDNVDSFYDTFTDYISFFILADLDVVDKSVKDFVDKVSKNKTNLDNVISFIDAAVYNPASQFCSDDIYSMFARHLNDNKRVDKDVKLLFKTNAEKLANSKLGASFTNLNLMRGGSAAGDLNSLKAKYTVVIMNIDGDLDTSLMKLRLSTDVVTNSLAKDGSIAIVSLYSDRTKKIEGDSDNWYTATVGEMERTYDMRLRPTVYILDADKKIAAKGMTTDQILALMAGVNVSAEK